MTSLVAVAVAGALLLTPPVLLLAHTNTTHHLRLAPITTGATAATLGLAAVVAVAPADPVHLVSVGSLAVLGLAAALVDLTEGRLPDRLTAALLAATLLLLVVAGVRRVGDAAAGIAAATVLTALAFLAMLVAPQLLGWGDLKLLPSLGALLGRHGPEVVLHAVVLWLVLVAVTAAAVAVRGRESVPYGPALVLGTLAALAAD